MLCVFRCLEKHHIKPHKSKIPVQILCKFWSTFKMMNTNIVVSLDTRRAKKGGLYPLVLRIGHHERTASIPLKFNIAAIDWDEQSRQVKKTYVGAESSTRINNAIQKSKSDALQVILKLQETGELDRLSVTDLRNRITSKQTSASFFSFTEKEIESLRTANRISTARSYKGVKSVLETFNGSDRLTFKDINYKFLIRFERDHLAKGNGYNGLSVYLRAIRAIYNKAIKEGVVDKADYPFDDYKIKSAPTQKRALDHELLKKIIEKKLPKKHACFDARNYFVASFMMYGMNFTDMAFLRKENIVDGRLQYRRRKTSKVFDIKMTPSLEEIFAHYAERTAGTPYVFPIIKRDNLAAQYTDSQWARKRYNKKLKELAKECGIEQNLTSYVSRHTFATEALTKQIPLAAISAMLGHSSLKTTEVYLKGLSSNALDEYNDVVIGDL
jgi:integrase